MKRILVVDDDIDILTVVQLVLETNGFEVAAISNWQQIYPQIDAFAPDLVLLDVSLGTQDGRNICKQLKSLPNTRHIPILIFSAYPSIAERVIYEYGADDFIAKPFEVNDLVTKVHSVLSQPAIS